MVRQCKCRGCGKTIAVKESYKYEFLDSKMNFLREYYCTEDCFEQYQKAKIIKDEFMLRMNRLLLLKTDNGKFLLNIEIKKLLETYDYKTLNECLIKEKFTFKRIVDTKTFDNERSKVKYVFVVLEAKLKEGDK